MDSSPLGVKGSISGDVLSLMSKGSTLSSKIPSFQTSSSTIKVVFVLQDELESFHEEVKMDASFVQPARTYATVVSFESMIFILLCLSRMRLACVLILNEIRCSSNLYPSALHRFDKGKCRG